MAASRRSPVLRPDGQAPVASGLPRPPPPGRLTRPQSKGGSAMEPLGAARLRVSRRTALRSVAGVAGAVAVSSLATACGPQAAAPTKVPVIFTLVWRPWYNFPNGTSASAMSLYQEGIRPWLDKHRGVRVQISTMGYQTATIAAMLAGAGPDVFEDWVLPPYIEQNLVYNFEPYLRQENINTSLFPKGEMDFFYSAGHFNSKGGLYCLPAYIHTLAMAVNEDVLDTLGQTYPQPDWTYRQWSNLWLSTTVKSPDAAKQRYGGQLYWGGYDYHGSNPSPFYLKGFGGGYVDPSDPTKCILDHPGSIACLEWAYGLHQEQAIGYGNFALGQQVTQPRGTAGGLPYSVTAWKGIKWNLYPMPVWPKGRYTFAASDFYAIYNGTKRPDIAWSFLKFLCVDTHWQRFMMRMALNGPNQGRLYPEWARVVQSVAPPLRGKNLNVIVQAVQQNEPYFGHSFEYNDLASAEAINRYTGLALSQKMSVTTATREATRVVNALQKAGRTTTSSSSRFAHAFAPKGPMIAKVQPGL